MSSVQTTASRPRQNKLFSTILLVAGAAVLAAGIAFLVIRLTDKGSTTSQQQATPAAPSHASKAGGGSTSAPPHKPALPHIKYSALPPAVRATIHKFVMTAVVRRNVASSYDITTPGLRLGMGKKAWASGDIPVQPYPVYKFEKSMSGFVVRAKTKNEIAVRMQLQANPKTPQHATSFDIGVHKFGTGSNVHWKVDYWMPYYPPAMPMAGGGGAGGA